MQLNCMKEIIIQEHESLMTGIKAKKMVLLFTSCHWQVKVYLKKKKESSTRFLGLHKESVHFGEVPYLLEYIYIMIFKKVNMISLS